MHRGPRKVVADRLQQHFHPAPRHRDAGLGERWAGQVVREHARRPGRHGEGRDRRARIAERAAALGAPVAEAIVAAGRLRADGGRIARAVVAGAGAARDLQQEARRPRLIDGEAPVGGDVFEPADLAAGSGPAHLDGLHGPLAAQPEVQCGGRLGEVGAAEAHLPHLRAGGRAHRDPRADRLRVAVPAGEVECEPAIAPLEDVAKDRGRGAVVGDEDVHPAVAVVVGADDAPALARVAHAERRRALREGAVPVGHEEPRGVQLQRGDPAPLALRARDGLAVPAAGQEQVLMAVVVEVGEAGASLALPHAGFLGGDRAGDVGEARTGVVAQHLARAEVAGQQEVGVAVAVDVREGRREREFAPVAGAGERAGADWHHVAHVLVAPLAVVAPEIADRRPQRVPGPVPVGEEGVEIAVRVVVGCGHGRDGGVRPAAEEARHLREPPAAVVAERLNSFRVEREEVGHAVVVEVDEVASPVHRGRRNAAVAGRGREAAAVPAEEAAGLAGPVSHVKLGPAVAVHVGEGEAAALPASLGGLRVVAAGLDEVAQVHRFGYVHETGGCAPVRGRWPARAGRPGQRQQADETAKERRQQGWNHRRHAVPPREPAVRTPGCRDRAPRILIVANQAAAAPLETRGSAPLPTP